MRVLRQCLLASKAECFASCQSVELRPSICRAVGIPLEGMEGEVVSEVEIVFASV